MAASQDIGTAKMSLTLDTTDYDIAVERSKQKQAGLGETAKAEAEKMTRAQRQVIQSLENQANRIGLTREQWLQYKVITQTTGETQKALLARIQANTAALEKEAVAVQKTVNARNAYGLTQKQEVAALRQVPAQLTDIFVSLQGGQNPLTVLLQQGGQLRDVFGGAVPAIRALGSAVMGLVNPYTVTAAALGVVIAAAVSGEQRLNAFNEALILTGQQGRMTAEDLNEMALALDEISGVTARQGASALTAVIATGKIASEQAQLVAEAAARMEDATGKAMDKTIEEYAEIAKDPLQAVLRFNEAEHFLTQSIYERIKAMQDAGDIEGAAALATETRAAAQIQRAQDVVESLGLISGAWHSIKEATGEAWDGATNYFTQLDKDAKEATGTLTRLWQSWKLGGVAGMWGAQSALLPPADVASPATDPIVNTVVQKQLDALLAGNKSREERQKQEEDQIVNLYKQLNISKEDKRVQDALNASRARYKESLPKGDSGASARGLANAGASAALQAIKDQEEVQRAEIANTSKVLQAEYAARLVTQQDYYRQQRDLVTRDQAAQEQSLVKQIEYLRSRDVAGKDSINVSKQLGELEARLAKVRADGATQLVILGIQEQDVAEKRQRAIDGYKESLQTANEAAQRSADAALARIIMGEREAAQQEKIAAVLADSAEKQRQLNREFAENGDAAAYEEKLAALQAYTDTQVRIVEEGYRRMREAEGDWLNGLQGGIAQWMEGAANVAQQTNDITQRGLNNVTQAFVNFATTGKSQWKSLLADIGTEIAKFMAKQAVMQFIQLFASYWTGGMSSNTGSLGMTDLGNSNWTMAAKGGVFDGAKGLSAHSGTVVSQPTPFYFAKGAGIMGEAGDEGIFPLARGADGKLGVKAMGGAGGAPVYIDIDIAVAEGGNTTSETSTAGGQRAMYQELGTTMANVAKQEITKAIMPGGLIWKARGGN